MKKPAYKYGDRIKVGHNPGKVISVSKIGDEFWCRIEFDDKNLIPPEMNYEEWRLSPVDGENSIRCPICYTKWHVDKYNKEWKDCLKCNKKAEDILKDFKDKEEYKKGDWGW